MTRPGNRIPQRPALPNFRYLFMLEHSETMQCSNLMKAAPVYPLSHTSGGCFCREESIAHVWSSKEHKQTFTYQLSRWHDYSCYPRDAHSVTAPHKGRMWHQMSHYLPVRRYASKWCAICIIWSDVSQKNFPNDGRCSLSVRLDLLRLRSACCDQWGTFLWSWVVTSNADIFWMFGTTRNWRCSQQH